MEELVAAVYAVAGVVTATQEAVNGLSRIASGEMFDLSTYAGRIGQVGRETRQAVPERILARVRDVTTAVGELQHLLDRADGGTGELARPRA